MFGLDVKMYVALLYHNFQCDDLTFEYFSCEAINKCMRYKSRFVSACKHLSKILGDEKKYLLAFDCLFEV